MRVQVTIPSTAGLGTDTERRSHSAPSARFQYTYRSSILTAQDATRVQSGCLRELSGSSSSTVRTKPERNQGAINIKLNVRSTPTQVARIHLLPTRRLTTVDSCVTTRPRIHIPATTPHILTSSPSHPHSEGDVSTLRRKPTPKDTPAKACCLPCVNLYLT